MSMSTLTQNEQDQANARRLAELMEAQRAAASSAS
jgi:hypothetical protein